MSGALIREDEGIQKLDVLHQSFYEQTTNQIPKAEKVGAHSLHHLQKAQALLSNLSDHGPYRASSEKCYRELRSNATIIEIGIGAEALWILIQAKTAIKGQALADFIADFTAGATVQCNLLEVGF